jgi:Holliday junction resolvase
MKRQHRNPEKFDTLELYTALSRQQNYRIDVPSDLKAFTDRIGVSLKGALEDPKLLYGKRTEAMFAHVLGALGGCKHIKQEDAGVSFSKNDDLVAPDYRIVTNEGVVLLVEVKNFHMRNLSDVFKIRRPYLKKLTAYAEMNKVSLKFAIYFSAINQWLLLSPESFLEGKQGLFIDLPHAMARNEMSLVGDVKIATSAPLRIEFFGDPSDEKANVADDDTAVFTIRDVQMSYAGKPIIEKEERRIAFYLMRYGTWSEIKSLRASKMGDWFPLRLKLRQKNLRRMRHSDSLET